MLCLNPIELPLVNKYYSPSEEEVELATEVIDGYNDSVSKDGAGVSIVRGKFIGPPLLKRAKELIKKHTKIIKNKNK
jgi:citrate lyase subunit beta / citryl-CoA lyase